MDGHDKVKRKEESSTSSNAEEVAQADGAGYGAVDYLKGMATSFYSAVFGSSEKTKEDAPSPAVTATEEKIPDKADLVETAPSAAESQLEESEVDGTETAAVEKTPAQIKKAQRNRKKREKKKKKLAAKKEQKDIDVEEVSASVEGKKEEVEEEVEEKEVIAEEVAIHEAVGTSKKKKAKGKPKAKKQSAPKGQWQESSQDKKKRLQKEKQKAKAAAFQGMIHSDVRPPHIPAENWNQHFGNFQNILPAGVQYRKSDVAAPLADGTRGEKRLIKGSDGSVYFTSDHYNEFKKVNNPGKGTIYKKK